MWLRGASFLQHEPETWPVLTDLLSTLTEVRKTAMVVVVVAHIQQSAYSDKTALLGKKKILKSSFQKLSLFMHEMKLKRVTLNVIRVGGRLANAGTLDAKFPAILPTVHGIPPPPQSSRRT